LEQRFMERVPGLLHDLTEAINGLAERMPEKKEKAARSSDNEWAEWKFDEEMFVEHYCPMEGGNDYLGWIDDICKLLDGEALPGDAASTGDYAGLSEDELKGELHRLKGIVLQQAFDRYMYLNYK